MQDPMRQLFDHMFWADQRVLELLDVPETTRVGEARRLLAHVLAAERVWLLRLRGEDSSIQPVWPSGSLEELREAAARSRTGYVRLLEELGVDDLQRRIEYTNSQGVAFRTRVVDVLTHVALHGSYHRGQIATEVRRVGLDPVNTDYITYVRELG